MNTGFYELLGTRFAIHCDNHDLGSEIHRLLDSFAIQAAPQRPAAFFSIATADDAYRLSLAGEELVAGSSDAVLDGLMSRLNYTALERCPYLASHAGVVALGTRGIAFPGPSGSGKTTLTAACVQSGFGYLSDEALCIENDTGAVVPYPKPLNVWPQALAKLHVDVAPGRIRPLLLTPDDLGGTMAQPGIELSDVVIRETNIDGTSPEMRLWPVPRAQLLMTLMRNAFNHYKYRRVAFEVAARIAERTRAWRLTYDDPVAAAALLRAELG
ncbi:MAG: hypothetical protein ACRDKT_17045 [Actinomycetota bacterium]